MSVAEIKQEEMEINRREVFYLKKNKVLKRLLIIVGVLTAAIVIIVASLAMLFVYGADSDKVTDVTQYSKCLGSGGEHSNNYLIKNDIFPESIPGSARVEDFCYYYYNPWDPNYVAYLVYTCSKAEYAAEVKRLSGLNSSKDYFIYGSKGFNYPVCAVYADKYNGYVYALADEENCRLIYVEITFCNFFSDIDYEKIVDQQYLPVDFDAKKGNPTRRAFDNGNIRLNE